MEQTEPVEIARLRAVSAPALMLLLLAAACGQGSGIPDVKQQGVFTQSGGYLVEMRKLGTLADTYGPRLYPELPEYSIPVVTEVGPIYVNVPGLDVGTLKGIEWHGYRLGGNGSAGSRSTATAVDWTAVPIVSQATGTGGIVKILVASAEPKTGRWKPQSTHEYFGLAVDAGRDGGAIWAVKIK